MKTTLKDIATIQTGLYAQPEPSGDVVYLQVRHFDANGRLDADFFPDLKITKRIENHLLQPGDILFAAKGNRNFATWYEVHDPPAVASTTFFVIRINKEFVNLILPAYLVWFFNQPNTQLKLSQYSRGSFIPSIPKSRLVDLEVSIPSIQSQKEILSINELFLKEKDLSKRIIELREQIIDHHLTKALNKLS